MTRVLRVFTAPTTPTDHLVTWDHQDQLVVLASEALPERLEPRGHMATLEHMVFLDYQRCGTRQRLTMYNLDTVRRPVIPSSQ